MDKDDALFQENERTAPKDSGRIIASLGAFALDSGVVLPELEIAYEIFGELNADKSNAILVCHALSGDSHCIGWWSRLIGPAKALDTNKFAVIGTNSLGGCQGSTGPLTTNPATGLPYGREFPQVAVEDMVRAQALLLDQLGIKQLHMVCGGSMGGMQALEWARAFGERVRKVWLTATCAKHSAMQIGFNETARQAVLVGGEQGLAVARMVGHLSYLSAEAFERKFGRERREDGTLQVASYLAHQGFKFIDRFDPWSLVVLSQAIDDYSCDSIEGCPSEFLITSFTSDWLYTSAQSREILRLARAAGCTAQWHEIEAWQGHDAFLLDDGVQADIVRSFI